MKISYIGKTLLIENVGQQNVLVIGDLHLGFEESLRQGGLMMPLNIFDEVVRELENVFEKTGNVNKVILLGDVKHEFGRINWGEREEINKLFEYLLKKCHEIIIVKGNHDVIVNIISDKNPNVKLVDYYCLDSLVFMHGDRDFGEEIRKKDLKTWILAHGHPAITLEERRGSKKEKYKCFLEGKYKDKKIILMPSFFDVNEGTDVLGEYDLGYAWDFDLEKFDVKIVQDFSLETLDFGKLKRI